MKRRSVADDVFAVLPGPQEPGLTPREIHQKMDGWAIPSVRRALTELADDGRAIYHGADTQRLYRKGPPA